MFSNLFSSKWIDHTIQQATASRPTVTVRIAGLKCKKHTKNNKKKFLGDSGAQLASWLETFWMERGNNAYRMLSGSPWKQRVELNDCPPFDIEITYHKENSPEQMASETLDAIINILEDEAT